MLSSGARTGCLFDLEGSHEVVFRVIAAHPRLLRMRTESATGEHDQHEADVASSINGAALTSAISEGCGSREKAVCKHQSAVYTGKFSEVGSASIMEEMLLARIRMKETGEVIGR